MLLAAGCARDPQLDAIAEVRLAQVERCDCLSHEGFAAAVAGRPGWHGEVLASSFEPLTLEAALPLWAASPTHHEVLTHPATGYGFATSARAAPSGRYYAVLVVEQH